MRNVQQINMTNRQRLLYMTVK